MFRKSYWKKRFAPVLAGALVISSLLVPPGHAFAADPVTSEEQTVSPETPEVKDVTDSTDAATTDANLTTPDSVSDSVSDSVAGTSATDASSGKEAAKQDVKETKEVKAADDAVTDPIPDKTPHLVYGDKSLADEDAFVLLIFGDGFTASEQDSFYTNAQNTADYLMDTSPWDEFKDTIKIYALGVVSNESGAKADTAINQEQANADTRDRNHTPLALLVVLICRVMIAERLSLQNGVQPHDFRLLGIARQQHIADIPNAEPHIAIPNLFRFHAKRMRILRHIFAITTFQHRNQQADLVLEMVDDRGFGQIALRSHLTH